MRTSTSITSTAAPSYRRLAKDADVAEAGTRSAIRLRKQIDTLRELEERPLRCTARTKAVEHGYPFRPGAETADGENPAFVNYEMEVRCR